MILNNEHIKRLVIYFIFDKDGIVDDYILYMLQALKACNNEIAIVCNGKLTVEGRKKLEYITPTIMVRENKGYDVWAYKTMLDYYGWEKLAEYDEVVMMNYTIMGPVYPLEEMFHKMNAKDIDFWGITRYHEYKEGDPFGTIECGYIPAHIQSHFIAVRNKMLRSIEFQRYWNEMKEIKDYKDAVGCHEAIFTQKFSDAGYTWAVYADVEEEINNHPILCATKEMVQEKRCPVFKRRSFMHNYSNILHDTYGQETIELLKFLDEHTEYDTNMIWQNMLRLENMADIKKNMQLNYILPTKKSGTDVIDVKNKKIALLCSFMNVDSFGMYRRYIDSMPAVTDIYVVIDDEKKKRQLEEELEKQQEVLNRVQICVINPEKRDTILIEWKEKFTAYDYLCVINDDRAENVVPKTIVEGAMYKNLENLLATRSYVENVLKTFEENPYLGMLMPPTPNHGTFYNVLGAEWGNVFQEVKELAKKQNFHVTIQKEKEPIAPLMGMFWLKTKAFNDIWNAEWKLADILKEVDNERKLLVHILNCLYGVAVQNAGYYPAWVMTEECAAIELTNLNFMLRELNRVIFEEGVGGGNGQLVLDKVRRAFEEWRLSVAAPEDCIRQSRLYLKIDGSYSEDNSFIVIKDTYKESYWCKDFSEYEAVSEVRWDPGERAGIKIKSLLIVVKNTNGEEYTFELRNVRHNGFIHNERLYFLAKDPQIYITLPNEMKLKSMEIKAEISDNITSEEINSMLRMSGESSIKRGLKKIKNRIFR